MIRLGTLSGYFFEGPRVLAGFTAPAKPGVYVVMTKTDPAREQFAVIYAGHADDLSTVGFPFQHKHSARWVKRAGDRFKLFVAWFEVPGGLPSHREQIVHELLAVYKPSCNDEQYESTWKDEWIGGYSTPGTTGPLTTSRTPPDEERAPDEE
ncbi:hypothetical protein [Kineosporia sp. R_H_3]|uniref:hypothetical protein n=1 Tax=Kineosporia sp. R_H_3 TaxID=1961848 RepID=UPI000B4AA45A|nr:hypothetical protein [Kineosporia sp. R_H_3]